MTPSEIRKKKLNDLVTILAKARQDLSVMRLNIKVGDVGSIAKAKAMKKDIARI